MNSLTNSQKSRNKIDVRHNLRATHDQLVDQLATEPHPSGGQVQRRPFESRERLRLSVRKAILPDVDLRIGPSREAIIWKRKEARVGYNARNVTSSSRPRSMKFSIYGSTQRMVAGVGLLRGGESTRHRFLSAVGATREISRAIGYPPRARIEAVDDAS